jgi:peroxiredoxin
MRGLLAWLEVMGTILLCSSGGSCAATSLLSKRAPDFRRVDLRNAPVHLADYRGKIVLLNFWATWCAPCLYEMPRFVEWQTKYGTRGLQVLGVSMDDADSPVRRLSRKLHINYPVMMGDERLGELYGGILGLPVTYLIDRKGIVRVRFQGETDLSKIEEQLKVLLSAPSTASPR